MAEQWLDEDEMLDGRQVCHHVDEDAAYDDWRDRQDAEFHEARAKRCAEAAIAISKLLEQSQVTERLAK